MFFGRGAYEAKGKGGDHIMSNYSLFDLDVKLDVQNEYQSELSLLVRRDDKNTSSCRMSIRAC